MKKYKMTNDNYLGPDEVNEDFYECECGNGFVFYKDNFCSKCGVQLIWAKEVVRLYDRSYNEKM